MPKVFISYRRADSQSTADRIHDRLANAFDDTDVFQDVFDIKYGLDFRSVIQDQLDATDVMLVIVGRIWATISDESSATEDSQPSRLFDADDPVRIEVEIGLSHDNVQVIPVLVNDAKMPHASDLPSSLHNFAYLNAIQVRNNPYFAEDMSRLISRLREIEREKYPRKTLSPSRRLSAGLVGLAIVAAIILVMVIRGLSTSDDEPTATPTAAVIDPVAIARGLLAETEQAQQTAAITTNTPDRTQTIEAIFTRFAQETIAVILQTEDARQTANAAMFTETPSPTLTLAATATTDRTATRAAEITQQAQDTVQAQQTQDADTTIIAQAASDEPTNTPQPLATNTATTTSTPTPSPTNEPSRTPTPEVTVEADLARDIENAQATLDAQEEFAGFPPIAIINSAQSVNARSGPGTSFEVVTSLQRGDVVVVIGEDENSDWINVVLDDGTTAWIFEDLLDVLGTDPAAIIEAGRQLIREGQSQKAIDVLNRAIEIDPENASGYHQRGRAQSQINNYQLAIADYTQAIELNQPDQDAFMYLNRGNAYDSSGEYVDDPALIAADFLKWIEISSTIIQEHRSVTDDEPLELIMAIGRVYRIPFEATAGQILRVTVTSTGQRDVDPIVVVLDPDQQPIAGNDDAVGLNSGIDGFSLASDGEYTLLVSHAGLGSEGTMTVQIVVNDAE